MEAQFQKCFLESLADLSTPMTKELFWNHYFYLKSGGSQISRTFCVITQELLLKLGFFVEETDLKTKELLLKSELLKGIRWILILDARKL